jgi:hypothetical protein
MMGGRCLFSNGVYLASVGDNYSAISLLNSANSLISGLAVQKTGNYLFVARSALNQLQVLNKTTGALIQTLTFSLPRALSVDMNGDLWMATGSNSVAKYPVNTNGTLNTPAINLTGLVDPLATQVSSDGSLICVADGGTSQQVKFYNNSTGASTSILGSAGGYNGDATVNDAKFYLNDVNGSGVGEFNKQPFIAFQSDGSFWVNDPGNYRVQHYNSAQTFVNRIMSLGTTYSVFADKNNINKVFSEFLEFEIDYSVQNLTGTTGWRLKKNWGPKVLLPTYNGSPRFETTLSNGRTYGLIRKNNDWEVLEFPSTGQVRFTGIILWGLTKILCSDGSLQDYGTVGTTATLKRYPLTGFDANNNPQWSTVPEILAIGTTNNVTGGPVEFPNSQVFSTDKVVFFNYKAFANNAGPVYSKGYHLGLMPRNATNNFLFQTEKSTHRSYEGDYPPRDILMLATW